MPKFTPPMTVKDVICIGCNMPHLLNESSLCGFCSRETMDEPQESMFGLVAFVLGLVSVGIIGFLLSVFGMK